MEEMQKFSTHSFDRVLGVCIGSRACLLLKHSSAGCKFHFRRSSSSATKFSRSAVMLETCSCRR